LPSHRHCRRRSLSGGAELTNYHEAHPGSTARIGYCSDISHGWWNADRTTSVNHVDLFKASLPWLYEVHLKNTDANYGSTFGFEAANVARGIVDVAEFRRILDLNTAVLPVSTLHCYLEIGGPKLGRDYSDHELGNQLRESLTYLRENFLTASPPSTAIAARVPSTATLDNACVMIAPSMICVDPLNFESALRQVEALGVDMLHMDIMDAAFVPNMPVGLGVLDELSKKTSLPVDVHLMVEDNDFFISKLAGLGVYQISVHAESCIHLDRTLESIRAIGARAGLAINPATPIETLTYVLERIDYVLLMTVNPGFAGQKLAPGSMRKIADCRTFLDGRGYRTLPIQVDGNVSFENIPGMVAAGARNLVCGTSSIFSTSGSWTQNFSRIRSAIAGGEQQSTCH
jgi:ribulose-phosphate 3-epimerase